MEGGAYPKKNRYKLSPCNTGKKEGETKKGNVSGQILPVHLIFPAQANGGVHETFSGRFGGNRREASGNGKVSADGVGGVGE